MVNLSKDLEKMSTLELRQFIQHPLADRKMKRRAGKLLKMKEAAADKIQEQQNRGVIKAKEVYQQINQKDLGKGMKVASVKNSVKNSLWGAGGFTGVVETYEIYKVIEIWNELEEAGAVPDKASIIETGLLILNQAEWSDFQMVVFWYFITVVFMLTMLYKFLKHYGIS